MDINYTPPPTIARFMQSNAKYRAIKGPVGSGKSVGCTMEIIRRASMQAPGKDGIRRTRCLVVRQTVRQLVDTTIKTVLDWLPPGTCGTFYRTTKTYVLKLGDVECEVLFRGLDDPDDVSNLNSLEVTFCWINECRDISQEIVDAITKRIGRYPSAKDGGPTWHGIWADTNPPVMNTYWYYVFEHIKPEDEVSEWDNGWEIFHQPSGLSPHAENIENLPDGYYDPTGRSEEYIRVFIHGEYGLSLAGKPVFSKFDPEYHVAKQALRPIVSEAYPIVVGMDLGLTPAAVIGQLDPRGRLLVLDELAEEDMGVQRFCSQKLKPLLFSRFPTLPTLIVVDPAGTQRAQTDERSAVDIIRAQGMKVMPARSNALQARFDAVDGFLMNQIDGGAAILIDPRCRHLRAALIGGYRFRLKTNGEVDVTPDKNKHSHIADALQYLALHASARWGAPPVRSRPVTSVSARGWT